ncbi:MAG: sigma-70 family RNA polymerase sigma factor [Planctomycetota bacterium]
MARAGDDFSRATEADDVGDRDLRAQFARVFAQNDRWLFAYLVTLLGSPADAEEVFQEVCVILWRDYDKFDPTTNFMKWASVIAHHQVHRFRRTQTRRAKPLSDAVVDLLADEAVAKADLMDSRRLALHDCLKKLPASDLELERHCYSDSRRSMKAVAELLGRPANTVYKAMNRIRQSLHGCIDRKLASEGTV